MMNKMSNQQIQEARSIFHNSSKAIKSILKQFQYDSTIPHADNMSKLGACLQSVIDNDFIEDFSNHISDIDVLPIEFNVQSIRFDNLSQLFQDWLHTQEQNSHSQFQHLITVKFRNILLKQILIEEKQAIDDYFEALSNQKRLKGFDLYQLLQTLLSDYYLYEYNSDSVSFFEKINSFENFIKVVDSFIVNERRIIARDKNNPSDYKYIRRFEFDQLLEFWEFQNQQLTLLHDPRKNHQDIGVQTKVVNSIDAVTQVSKVAEEFNYLSFINSAIHQVNKLIQFQNTPEVVHSLNRVFDVLRKEKIVALNNNYEIVEENQENNQTFSAVSVNTHYNIRNKTLIKSTPRNKSPVPPIRNVHQGEVEKIFQFIVNKNIIKKFSVSELQIFFYQIKLVKAHENYLVRNLLDHHFIEDPDDITLMQFKIIINQLIKESNKLSKDVLKEYIQNFATSNQRERGKNERRESRKTSRTYKKQYYGLLDNKEPILVNRSTFQLDSQDY